MLSTPSQQARRAMHNDNALKLGVFGFNCSSGRAATTVPERWPNTWDENLRLAQLADDAGIDFLLPIGRWKGYGGVTNFEGATWETITWACGLLAGTRRITVFGTVHAPLVHPVFAAKQFVTADHIGHGRFGLNIVCGWNEDEFRMFGVDQLPHDDRYAQGEEWIGAIRAMWERTEAFDIDGRFLHLHGVEALPKPFGGTRPVVLNAASSPAGRAFAVRNCDFLFTALRTSIEEGVASVEEIRASARAIGRDVGVFTAGFTVVRPTRAEAEEYLHYVADEHGDWEAVEHLLQMALRNNQSMSAEHYQRMRVRYAAGYGAYPFVGTPDDVAAELARVHAAGFTGVCFSQVNYLDEFPYFRDEVLPRLERLGLRTVRA